MATNKENILISKIALTQLRRAIQLFNISDYISALTLAGAANEMIGEFAIKNQGYNSLAGDKKIWDDISEIHNKIKIPKGKIKQSNNRNKMVLNLRVEP